ncbi:MAG: RNA polymerase sigma-70 factor [Tannerellaceae bacterium]|jgi:RNA polymerase sigma-70 factor (ECF subfamily)|nr:RNA polymerase sigma-70 factor [Tannerellaceae bacterium]
MKHEPFLWAQIRQGDIRRFETLFKHYHEPLVLYAAGITGNGEAAEEIVQELFYTLWKEREKYGIFHAIGPYLYRSVRNRALQYCEHRAVVERHRATPPEQTTTQTPQDNPQEILEYRELENLVNRTLRKLPERRRKIFLMHRMEGKKYAEIAATLSLSIKTIEGEMTKALRILRKEIENYLHIA